MATMSLLRRPSWLAVLLAATTGAVLLVSCGDTNQGGSARLTFFERSVSFLPDDSGLGGARTLEIADVTGDGQPDLIVGHPRSLEVWSRSGATLFRPQSSVLLPPLPDGAVEIRLTDLDGDGDLDLVLETGRGDLALWIQRASGSFSEETSRRLLGTSKIGALAALRVVDLDGNGTPDLFLSGV